MKELTQTELNSLLSKKGQTITLIETEEITRIPVEEQVNFLPGYGFVEGSYTRRPHEELARVIRKVVSARGTVIKTSHFNSSGKKVVIETHHIMSRGPATLDGNILTLAAECPWRTVGTVTMYSVNAVEIV